MGTNKPGYLRDYYERERTRIIKALGGQCIVCGSTENLDIHHHGEKWKGQKGKNGRGSLTRLTDWKRLLPLGKLRLLCVECHRTNHIEEKLAVKAMV